METSDIARPVYEDPAFPMLVMQGASGVYPSGWHEDLEIKINRSDKLYITLDSEVLCGNTDEIFFINPYQIHTSPNLSGINKEYDCIMLSLDFFAAAGIHSLSLRKIFTEDRIRLNNHLTDPALTAILNKIIALYGERQDPLVRTMIEGLLLEFFSIMLRGEVAAKNDRTTPDNSRYYHTIAPALEAIHKNYDKKLSSEELAQKCRLTHSYFCRLFKQVMGVTPIRYQTETRLRIADVFLKEGTRTVTDIARTVGFEDNTYFSRCYKKYRGTSPSKYKAQ